MPAEGRGYLRISPRLGFTTKTQTTPATQRQLTERVPYDMLPAYENLLPILPRLDRSRRYQNLNRQRPQCRSCGQTFSFSEISGGSAAGRPGLSKPPIGAWFEQSPQGLRVGAFPRSRMALYLLPSACVGPAAVLHGLNIAQPNSGQIDPVLSTFRLLFPIGSCFLIGRGVITVAGKVEISRSDDRLPCS